MAEAEKEKTWWTPAFVLSIVISVAFFFLVWLVLGKPSNEDPSPAAMILLGSMASAFGAVVQYYLGSSIGSAKKDASIRQMAERSQATEQAPCAGDKAADNP